MISGIAITAASLRGHNQMRWPWGKQHRDVAPLPGQYLFSVDAEAVQAAITDALTTVLVRERDVWDAVNTEVRQLVREELKKSEHQDRIRHEVQLMFERFPAIVHDDAMLNNVVQAIMGHFQTTRR
jgi:hypothetical protein